MDDRLPRFDRLPTVEEQLADINNSQSLGDMMNKGMVLDAALSQEHTGLVEHIQDDNADTAARSDERDAAQSDDEAT